MPFSAGFQPGSIFFLQGIKLALELLDVLLGQILKTDEPSARFGNGP